MSSSLVFNKSFNDKCRRLFFADNRPAPTKQQRLVDISSELGNLGETLLYHPGTALKVYGENVPLAMMLDVFGVDGVEKLIEQKAINFVLWTSNITYSISEIPNVEPIQSGNLSSTCHTDPEESILLGLQLMRQQPSDQVRKLIVRKARDLYQITPSNIVHEAAKLGLESFRKNIFSDLGLPNTKSSLQLNRAERAILCGLTEQVLELALVSHFLYDVSNCPDTALLSKLQFQKMADAKIIQQMTDTLFDLEGVPRFSQLIQQGILQLDKIPDFRATNDAQKFRAWISSHAAEDSQTIVKEYLTAISKKDLFDQGFPKLLKTISVSSLSGIVGASLAGPVGLVAGGVVGAGLVQPIIDSSLGLLDSYFLNSLLKGWNPKIYFEKQISPLVDKT